MDHLALAWLCAVAAFSSPARASDLAEWTGNIFDAERRCGMPAARIEAVLRVEIADENTLVSSKGAMRAIQIMPATRVDLRAHRSLATDPFEPRG